MTAIVKRFVGQNSYAVGAGTGTTTLPGGFVISPGNYVFNGQVFDCTLEGYYDFWNPIGNVTARRVVYNSDVPTLMSSLGISCAVGSQDDGLTVSQVCNQATTQKPRMLCGNTAAFIKGICDSLVNIGMAPVETRIFEALAGGATTSYFNGHAMIEAKVSGNFQLFDVALGINFGGAAGKDAIPLQAPVSRWITKEIVSGPVAPGEFDANSWIDDTMPDAASLQSEALRVLQIPGVQWADGYFHCYIPTGMSDAEPIAAGWVIETEANWLAGSY